METAGQTDCTYVTTQVELDKELAPAADAH